MLSRRLIVVTPEGERELLFIGRLTAGRAPECDISIADTKISRRHAEFDGSGPVPRVTDLGSRNGILVNGRKVGSADLAPGDVVTVGDATIRFEEQVVTAAAAAPALTQTADERTAIIAPAHLKPQPTAAVVPPPSPPAAAPLALAVPEPPASASGGDDRTMVLPRPEPRRAPVAAESPAAAAPPSPPSGAVAVAPTPAPPVPVAVRSASPPPPSAPSAPVPVSLPRPAEAALVAASPAAGAAPGTAPVPRGPRMSWGGFLTILLILLASIGVLLGVLPLISATSTTIDAMASRQARTLAGWLSSAVSEEGAIDQSVVDSVLSQDGVQQAVLLDAATGRVVAPSRLIGRPMADLPGAGGRWRSLRQPLVTTTGTARDALMPVAAGSAGHVAWVRYEPPAGSDSGLALIVALGATLVLALVVSLLIKRHTAAALHSFTRQVELAVSGANPKVMQGTLVPGLERLPGIVSYLLEQQKARITPEDRVLPSAPATARAVVDVPPPPPQPPWLEVTPSLSVAEVSPNAPPEVGDWTAAPGRHLLDVMTDAATRNAVVQALGALGMAAGAEVSMPVEGRPAVTLRRETSGHVRVTFATR